MPSDVLAEDVDRVFRALADPGRRRMVERLSQGPASVSELGKPLAITLSAVVQHVQILEASGLVRSKKDGRTRTCSLDASRLRLAEHWMTQRRVLIEHRLDRLDSYLDDTTAQPGPTSPRSSAKTRPGRGGSS